MSENTDPRLLMLQMQVEETEYLLTQKEEAHRKASARASAAEKRNKILRSQNETLEGQLRTLEQCWNCPDLGNREICAKCSNNSVFSENNGSFVWNDPRTPSRERRVSLETEKTR